MHVSKNMIKAVQAAALLATLNLVGCAMPTVAIQNPTPSTLKYASSGAPGKLYLKDARSDAAKQPVTTGILPLPLTSNNQPFNSFEYLSKHTLAELLARGVPVQAASDATDASAITVKNFHIDTHRANAFSPLVTYTYLSADLQTPAGVQKLTSYVRRGKVPVMTFDEVNGPCFDDALNIAVKEFAAKINRELFKQSISDEQVSALAAKIDAESAKNPASYLDVYQLGFGNNPKAVGVLVKLVAHAQEYVRMAAISSLGILGAKDQLPLLVGIYQENGAKQLWQDQAMALKAIGDLNTPESKAFLSKEAVRLQNDNSKAGNWTKAIIALYL